MRDDMRKTSAGGALVVVPTFIAGFCGMSFQHMPELSGPRDYPMALPLMAASVAGLWVLVQEVGLAVTRAVGARERDGCGWAGRA